MILAGIDEAGYGPLLGPLVVGCCAFELDGDPAAEELPCLWKRLRRVAAKSRDRKGSKLHINDSKQVYSPAAGLKELERSILALTAAKGGWVADLGAFLGCVGGGIGAELAEYAWYAPAAGERFPLEQEAVAVRIAANALKMEMERSATRCICLAARLVPERRLNRMLEQTRNKSSVLFSESASHLDHLLRTYGDKGLVIFCDRQGGREHYGHLLRLMFEEWALEVVAENEGDCEYRLTRQGHGVRILFREKAEAQCMPVAIASMLAKYTRETLMRRFNAYWQGLVPGVAPTAGYYSDGMRFLKDIEAKRQELGLADSQLVRMK